MTASFSQNARRRTRNASHLNFVLKFLGIQFSKFNYSNNPPTIRHASKLLHVILLFCVETCLSDVPYLWGLLLYITVHYFTLSCISKITRLLKLEFSLKCEELYSLICLSVFLLGWSFPTRMLRERAVYMCASFLDLLVGRRSFLSLEGGQA